MKRKYTIFNDFQSGVYGTVYAAKDREQADYIYNCVCGCKQLASDEICDCLRYPQSLFPEVRPHTFNYDDRQKYAAFMRMESDNPKLKYTHQPILTFTIFNKQTGYRLTMVSDNLNDIIREVDRLNIKYKKDVWTFEEEKEFNMWLVSQYHAHEQHVSTIIK